MIRFFRFLYVLNEFKSQIMDAYAAFMIWTIVRWIKATKSTVFATRDWVGGIGLLGGCLSWLLLQWYIVCCVVEDRNLAEGDGYFAYFVVSACIAIIAMILTLVGRSPVRGAAFVVSFVMVLQWRYMLGGGLGLNEVTTFATLILLLMYELISLCIWFRKRRVAQGQSAVNEQCFIP
ncbi:MAG: hypothetical protein ABSG84_10845 [Acidobacteriaceae bacterium]|jgi:hypothetical protein